MPRSHPAPCRRRSAAGVASLLLVLLLGTPAGARLFESGPVRPLALSPDGTRLFAVNTPDHRLEIFAVDDAGLSPLASVPVGLEPVAVAARRDGEVWVVNHLSDSVSVVDVAADPPRVVRTLLVGDEPRDIVFAGARVDGAFTRAFVTTARRGQHLPAGVPAALTTPGTPRALVWVFDASALGAGAGGAPEAIVELFGDTPRALAATPDGATVYAAVFHSGNQTTALAEGAVCNGGALAPPCGIDGVQVPGGLPGGQVPGGLPAPNDNVQGRRGPETGLIVRRDAASGEWRDELGRNWTNAVRFDLPDLDVFAIDALADPPVEIQAWPHVGTVLFNMVVDPASGALFVSNTEAHNEVRFEGPGTLASTVRGDLHRARITVIDGAGVRPRHLNKHLLALPQGYRTAPMPAAAKAASLATPLELAVASDGTLYVAAFGSSAVGRYPAAAIADDSFTPDAAAQIALSGGGPAGLALDEARQRLYVLTRFDNAVKVVDLAAGSEIAQHALHDAEPAIVRVGRRVLYDARATSSNGEASCAACHVFADFDSLAWDLGNPDEIVLQNPNPGGPIFNRQAFHPLKGPMTTQTLRGLAHGGPMHWRGDRTGGASGGDPLDEVLAFEAFNPAFPGLLGRDEGEIDAADMRAFAEFILHVTLPPNPVRALDNQLSAAQARGRGVYFGRTTDVVANCDGCHTLDPSQGFFGGDGRSTFEAEPQEFKVAHLRNAYQKVGMFGMPDVAFVGIPLSRAQHQGPQVRGYGFLHDGSIATVFDFLHATVFSLGSGERRDLEDLILAFDTTYAPIVGQQVTRAGADAAVDARIDLLIARARTSFALVDQPEARECDLVVKGTADGLARGWLLEPLSGAFRSDRAAEAPLADAALRALAGAATPLTYTCAPPGEGPRLALDRDGDGFLDRDERDAGSDPADAASTPGGATPTPTATRPTATPTSTPPRRGCPGDCSGDSIITIDELVHAVAIALGSAPLDGCANADRDGDGRVDIAELVRAVLAAVDGCELTPPPIPFGGAASASRAG